MVCVCRRCLLPFPCVSRVSSPPHHHHHTHTHAPRHTAYNSTDNDQPDNAQPSSSYGHTKGVVGVGDRPFWLLHSTPNFPSSDGKGNFYFPEEEIIYGQTFLCVAFDPTLIDDVAAQLLYTRPYVYVNLVSDAAAAGHPMLAGLLKDPSWVTTPGSSVKKFGQFTHVAKNSEWNQDMYEYLVSPTLGVNLHVESWLRGKVEGSYCPGTANDYKWTVLDAENLVARAADGTNVTWRESQDHAKWAVSTDAAHPWVCIADINRMTSQRVRGGGAFCFENAILAAQLTSAIVKHADCKGPKPSDSCCYTKSTGCTAGEMCCTSAGDSLAESSCKGVYGAKHHCQWVSNKCIVGKSLA